MANAPINKAHQAAWSKGQMTTPTRTCAAGDARDHLAEVINQAAYGSTRIVLTRHGKSLAAVVPMSDFELLNELERLIDVEEARKVLAAAKKEGVKPLEELAQELGL